MLLYHGTHVDSAKAFEAGNLLDAAAAAREHLDGEPGFYLAAAEADAEFFAARRWEGSVVVFDLSEESLRQLVKAGAERRPIPGGKPPYFEGDEIWVPAEAFALFNQLVEGGEIRVGR